LPLRGCQRLYLTASKAALSKLKFSSRSVEESKVVELLRKNEVFFSFRAAQVFLRSHWLKFASTSEEVAGQGQINHTPQIFES
jgi:hypothetical protein